MESNMTFRNGSYVIFSGSIYVFRGETLLPGYVLLENIDTDEYIEAPVDLVKEY